MAKRNTPKESCVFCGQGTPDTRRRVFRDQNGVHVISSCGSCAVKRAVKNKGRAYGKEN